MKFPASTNNMQLIRILLFSNIDSIYTMNLTIWSHHIIWRWTPPAVVLPEQGNKPCWYPTCLVYHLLFQAVSWLIPQIKDPSGSLTTKFTAINCTFQSFSSSLYQSEFPPDAAELTSFLDEIKFPTICPEIASKLHSLLILGEITFAISQIQNNNAPSSDWFIIEFYKKLQNKLALLLLSAGKRFLPNNFIALLLK